LVLPLRHGQVAERMLQRLGEDGHQRGPADDVGVQRVDNRPRGRILVAEDNIVNQKVIVAMLAKLGYESVVAADGDLVLMDCQMPLMDGLEATARIRDRQGMAELPIVALTAHAMSRERERCLGAGMNDYLAKPISLQILRETLAHWAG
jgi:CheY-like chemotaxis protein